MFEMGQNRVARVGVSWQEDKKIAARDGSRAAMFGLILRAELLWNGQQLAAIDPRILQGVAFTLGIASTFVGTKDNLVPSA